MGPKLGNRNGENRKPTSELERTLRPRRNIYYLDAKKKILSGLLGVARGLRGHHKKGNERVAQIYYSQVQSKSATLRKNTNKCREII